MTKQTSRNHQSRAAVLSRFSLGALLLCGMPLTGCHAMLHVAHIGGHRHGGHHHGGHHHGGHHHGSVRVVRVERHR